MDDNSDNNHVKCILMDLRPILMSYPAGTVTH